MLLTGAYARMLDEKNRVLLPRSIRAQLGDVARLFVTPWQDACLGLFTQEGLEQLGVKLDGAPETDAEVRVFRRLFYSRTESMDVDRHGRILIPEGMAQQAGLRKNVMLVGVRDHLEVWDAGRWHSYLGEHTPRFDAVAERAFRNKPTDAGP